MSITNSQYAFEGCNGSEKDSGVVHRFLNELAEIFELKLTMIHELNPGNYAGVMQESATDKNVIINVTSFNSVPAGGSGGGMGVSLMGIPGGPKNQKTVEELSYFHFGGIPVDIVTKHREAVARSNRPCDENCCMCQK